MAVRQSRPPGGVGVCGRMAVADVRTSESVLRTSLDAIFPNDVQRDNPVCGRDQRMSLITQPLEDWVTVEETTVLIPPYAPCANENKCLILTKVHVMDLRLFPFNGTFGIILEVGKCSSTSSEIPLVNRCRKYRWGWWVRWHFGCTQRIAPQGQSLFGKNTASVFSLHWQGVVCRGFHWRSSWN
jgi:hypothetical protein